jgi:hypothetical protein
MLKRILILLILALSQNGCTAEGNEEVGFYKPVVLSPESRQGWERLKREFLQLEEIKIGNGPVAAWGRKVSADIDVRYTDGTVVYRGSSFFYWGLEGDVFIHNSIQESGALTLQQTGIIMGLNGMAVGGKRRITVSPNLVCYGGAIGESTSQGANPNASCNLVQRRGKDGGNVRIRKERLIIEATLTASCIPVFRGSRQADEIGCRDSETPQRDPSDPIWRLYYAEPSHP